ncbi:MAG TPA: DUF2231 domain-containing protein [Candidatus Limnocylindrales bacterium]|nr:DUF2231 domain-containing protein [Candidatus Limnocylindrales bacterium]
MRETNAHTQRTVAARELEEAESPSSYEESSYSENPASTDGSGASTASTPLPAVDPRSFVTPEETAPIGVRKPPVPSAAAIAGHPLHPMVVPLPIGAFTFALCADLAYAATRDPFWAKASKVLIGTGIATGAVAGVLGATDFTARERVRSHQEAWLHGVGNAAALGLAAASLALRQKDEAKSIVPFGLMLSIATGTILTVTGWLGGELSYRHRIGVTED